MEEEEADEMEMATQKDEERKAQKKAAKIKPRQKINILNNKTGD